MTRPVLLVRRLLRMKAREWKRMSMMSMRRMRMKGVTTTQSNILMMGEMMQEMTTMEGRMEAWTLIERLLRFCIAGGVYGKRGCMIPNLECTQGSAKSI